MKHSYITSFFCLYFMSVMMAVAIMIDKDDTINKQRVEILRLNVEKIYALTMVIHLTKWHEMRTDKEQREFINRDKIRRVK